MRNKLEESLIGWLVLRFPQFFGEKFLELVQQEEFSLQLLDWLLKESAKFQLILQSVHLRLKQTLTNKNNQNLEVKLSKEFSSKEDALFFC